MRSLVLALLLAACSSGPTTCAQLTCNGGQVCGFASTTPACFTPCDPTDAGCPGGRQCTCVGSCAGCDDCRSVCPNVTR